MGDARLNTVEEWRAFLSTSLQNWSGREPASEDDVAAAEQRLGVRLPASYRSFLLTSNGGDAEDTAPEDLSDLCALFPVEEVTWLREGPFQVMVEAWSSDEDVAAVLSMSLHIGWGDGGDWWLLDPTLTGEGGEWAAHHWFPGGGEGLDAKTSFAAATTAVAGEG